MSNEQSRLALAIIRACTAFITAMYLYLYVLTFNSQQIALSFELIPFAIATVLFLSAILLGAWFFRHYHIFIIVIPAVLFAVGYFAYQTPVMNVTLPFPIHAALAFSGIMLLVALVHFVLPNKLTEPVLILLPVTAFAWLFLNFVYAPALYCYQFWMNGDMIPLDRILRATYATPLSYDLVAFPLVILSIYLIAKYASPFSRFVFEEAEEALNKIRHSGHKHS